MGIKYDLLQSSIKLDVDPLQYIPGGAPLETTSIESVQYFGRKKTVVAVTHCKRGRGLIKINGGPIELVVPEILRFKAVEPILLLDRHRFARVDMRIRVKGGGHTSQIYAIRQSITKALRGFDGGEGLMAMAVTVTV
ncbi:hypothetical protein ACFE04_028241 [Oxalis oulophora]